MGEMVKRCDGDGMSDYLACNEYADGFCISYGAEWWFLQNYPYEYQIYMIKYKSTYKHVWKFKPYQ